MSRTQYLFKAILLLAAILPVTVNAKDAVRPDNPVAALAFDALKRHCARCHQKNALERRTKPAAQFGTILQFEKLIASSNLIDPGNPDGSRIYTMITKGEMPHDVRQQFSERPAPTADEIDAVRQWIRSLPPRVMPFAQPKARTRYSFDLELKTNKQTYRKDERVTIEVTSSQPCYLTLININDAGLATVIFPNDFERENVIAANDRMVFPRPGAPYIFPVRIVGRETVVAHCSLSSPTPLGITHNYIEQRFTEIGDYSAHMRRNHGADTVFERERAASQQSNIIKLPDVKMTTAVQFDVKP